MKVTVEQSPTVEKTYPLHEMRLNTFAIVVSGDYHVGNVVYRTVTLGTTYPFQFIGINQDSTGKNNLRVRDLRPNERIVITGDTE